MRFSKKAFRILTIVAFASISINNRPIYGNIILNRQVNNLTRQAENNFDKNNYSKAIKLYSDAIERDSSKASLFLFISSSDLYIEKVKSEYKSS